MAFQTHKTLSQALEEIEFKEEYHHSIVQEEERESTKDIIDIYGKAKWAMVDILNQRYHSVLKDKFDLYNWLDYNENDEVAYFLNEAGSNALNHSEFKAPHRFHLWLGRKGFIIGIEQKGKGFNVAEISNGKRGGGFDFFEKCKSIVFFDDSQNARTVFMEWKI